MKFKAVLPTIAYSVAALFLSPLHGMHPNKEIKHTIRKNNAHSLSSSRGIKTPSNKKIPGSPSKKKVKKEIERDIAYQIALLKNTCPEEENSF